MVIITCFIHGYITTQYTPIKKFTTLIEFVELNVTTKTETPTGELKETYWH